MEYSPVHFKIEPSTKNILDHKVDPELSNNVDMARFELGFQHFIHANFNKKEIFEQFEGKKKVYNVINPFEIDIDNYEQDIHHVTETYFPKTTVLSRGFYKMWELISTFDLIDPGSDFNSLHLNDAEGGSTQAVIAYRDKFSKKSNTSSDNYQVMTTSTQREGVKTYKSIDPQFAKIAKSDKRIDIKSSKKQSGGASGSADLITAYGELEWLAEMTIESEAFKLIVSEIQTALVNQKKGGHFVCKIFESFCLSTVKLIDLLTHVYEEVYIAKPFMSRSSNIEKFLVCKRFKSASADKTVLAALDQLTDTSNKYYVNIFPTYYPDPKFISMITDYNLQIANEQFKTLNEMLDYVNQQNFYGDTYQEKRDQQIGAAIYWINKFYPSDKPTDKPKKSK
jgi:hypothetical protein